MIELAEQGCGKRTPYTTKSGLRIGSLYEPPRKNSMSDEEEFWQNVFLGIRPSPSTAQVIVFAVYVAALATVFAVLALVVKP